jgi:hypothetical protein
MTPRARGVTAPQVPAFGSLPAEALAQASCNGTDPKAALAALMATGLDRWDGIAHLVASLPWEDAARFWVAQVRKLTSGPNITDALDRIAALNPKAASRALEALPSGMAIKGDLRLRDRPWVVSLPHGLQVDGVVSLEGCVSLLAIPTGLKAHACRAEGCPWVEGAPPPSDLDLGWVLGPDRIRRLALFTDGQPHGHRAGLFTGPAGDPLATLPGAQATLQALLATAMGHAEALGALAPHYPAGVLGRLAEPWLLEAHAQDAARPESNGELLGAALMRLAVIVGPDAAQAALDRLGWLDFPCHCQIPSLPDREDREAFRRGEAKLTQTWLVRLPPGWRVNLNLSLEGHLRLRALPAGLRAGSTWVEGCPSLARIAEGTALGSVMIHDPCHWDAEPFVTALFRAGHAPDALLFGGEGGEDLLKRIAAKALRSGGRS